MLQLILFIIVMFLWMLAQYKILGSCWSDSALFAGMLFTCILGGALILVIIDWREYFSVIDDSQHIIQHCTVN